MINKTAMATVPMVERWWPILKVNKQMHNYESGSGGKEGKDAMRKNSFLIG